MCITYELSWPTCHPVCDRLYPQYTNISLTALNCWLVSSRLIISFNRFSTLLKCCTEHPWRVPPRLRVCATTCVPWCSCSGWFRGCPTCVCLKTSTTESSNCTTESQTTSPSRHRDGSQTLRKPLRHCRNCMCFNILWSWRHCLSWRGKFWLFGGVGGKHGPLAMYICVSVLLSVSQPESPFNWCGSSWESSWPVKAKHSISVSFCDNETCVQSKHLDSCYEIKMKHLSFVVYS